MYGRKFVARCSKTGKKDRKVQNEIQKKKTTFKF